MSDPVEFVIVCPACHRGERSSAEQPLSLRDIGLFVCNACGLRAVHGVIEPRVVIEPFVDARDVRWVRIRYQNAVTRRDLFSVDIDPDHAARAAVNLLSITVGT